MANCEFRIGSSFQVESHNIQPNLSVFIADKGVPAPICRIMAEGAEAWSPKCELPNFSTADCPIAQFQKNELSLTECNSRLNQIFENRRNNVSP
jgi:hypothetical protein